MTTIPTKRSRPDEIQPDSSQSTHVGLPNHDNNNMINNTPSFHLSHSSSTSLHMTNDIVNNMTSSHQHTHYNDEKYQQPGISTTHESTLESTLPTAPFYSMAYPHSHTVTHTVVSNLGIFITATDNGAINLWHLGDHDKIGGLEPNNNNNIIPIPNQAKFRISFPLYHPNTPLLSLMVSSCGVYCVSVGVDGSVYVLNLLSFVIENKFNLPILPSSCLLLQPYTNPTIVKSLQLSSHAQHHYNNKNNKDSVNGALLTAINGQKILNNNKRDLTLCVGTSTGHIFCYPVHQQSSTIFVSFVSQYPILTMSAIPINLLKPLLENNQTSLTPTQQQQQLSYPFLNQAEGYFLILTDTQGNLEPLYLPPQFTTSIPDLDLNQIGSSLATNDINEAITQCYNSVNPHQHKVLPNGINLPQIVAIVKPQQTSMNPINRDSDNNNSNGLMTTITATPTTTLFWGSLGQCILPSIFNTTLFPTMSLKSQTDLFILKKNKKIAISTQLSPNGLYLLLTCIPQLPLGTVTTPITSTGLNNNQQKGPYFFTYYLLSMKNLKLLHTFDENYPLQYPSHNSTTIGLSSQLLYQNVVGNGNTPSLPQNNNNRMTPSSSSSSSSSSPSSPTTTTYTSPTLNNAMLLERLFTAPPDTNSIWDSVQLGTDLPSTTPGAQSSSSTSSSSTTYMGQFSQSPTPPPILSSQPHNNTNNNIKQDLTMVPNPFYLPTMMFNDKMALQTKFIQSIYTSHITPLNTLLTNFNQFSMNELRTATTNNQNTKQVNPQQFPATVCNTTQYDSEPFYTTFLSTFHPIISLVSHSTSMIQSDLCIFDKNSEYLFYSTIFGIKCVRLRDGFTIISPTTFTPSPSKLLTNCSSNNNNMEKQKDITHNNCEYNIIGGKEIFLEPTLLHQNLLLVDQSYFSQKNDANLVAVSLLLSHNDKVAHNTNKGGKDKTYLDAGIITPTILPSTRQPTSNLHHPTHNPPSTNLITTGFNGNKVMQYSNQGGLPFLSTTAYPTATNHINLLPLSHALSSNDINPITTPPMVTHSTHHFIGLRPSDLTTQEITRFTKSREVLTQISSLTSVNSPSASSSTTTATTNVTNTNIKQPQVTLHTTYGDITFSLYPQYAPKACENFISLSQRGYYNGLTFHRIIKSFMIQGGDPTGTGRGGESIWGKTFEDEFTPKLKHDSIGTLSMANSGPHSNGSQFFITTTPSTDHLNNKHTVFGKLIKGESALMAIAGVKVGKDDRPLDPVKINSVTVNEDDDLD